MLMPSWIHQLGAVVNEFVAAYGFDLDRRGAARRLAYLRDSIEVSSISSPGSVAATPTKAASGVSLAGPGRGHRQCMAPHERDKSHRSTCLSFLLHGEASSALAKRPAVSDGGSGFVDDGLRC